LTIDPPGSPVDDGSTELLDSLFFVLKNKNKIKIKTKQKQLDNFD